MTNQITLIALVIVFFITLFNMYQRRDDNKGVMFYISLVALVGIAIVIFNSFW